MVNEVEGLNNIREELLEEERPNTSSLSQDSGLKISKLVVDRRASKPTGSAKCTISSGRQRRNDTIAALSAIHGGSEGNLRPVTIGGFHSILLQRTTLGGQLCIYCHFVLCGMSTFYQVVYS